MSLQLGEHTLGINPDVDPDTGDEYNIISMNVSRIYIHSSYSGNTESFANDIALIKLKWKISFNNEIRPVCLPLEDEIKQENLNGKYLVSSGFGELKIFLFF